MTELSAKTAAGASGEPNMHKNLSSAADSSAGSAFADAIAVLLLLNGLVE